MSLSHYPRKRGSERGQTILLVAVSMVSLLALAALAIDVVTLYVARTEVQRAADAAALVGAKALADSGMTTLTSADANLPSAKILAQSMATSAINAMLSATPPIANHVAGASPTLVGTSFNLALNYNPTVTVVLQQTNLPTFFARIFGQSASTTSASATAEAYNPSNQSTSTQITPRCVKPWLVGNLDPTNGGAQFVDPATGAVLSNLATLTATPFNLAADCKSSTSDCTPAFRFPMQFSASPAMVQYIPALVTPSPVDACSASCAGASNFEEGVSCCSATTYSCGGTTANAAWDSTTSPEHGRAASPVALATECLIHASTTGASQGQDTLAYPSLWPSGPPQITAGTANLMNGQVVTTSSSIVTIPIIAANGFNANTDSPVTVVGFLQAFVNEVSGVQFHVGEINITVLNVIGCSQTPNGNTPIVGGNGASAIPVRLITPP